MFWIRSSEPQFWLFSTETSSTSQALSLLSVFLSADAGHFCTETSSRSKSCDPEQNGLIWHAAPAGRLVSTRSPEMRFASLQSANTNLPAAGTRERSAPAILNTNVPHYAARKACLSWTPAALNLQECHFQVVVELSKTCLHWHHALSLLWWVCLFSRNKTRDSSEQRCDVSRVWRWSVSDGQVR